MKYTFMARKYWFFWVLVAIIFLGLAPRGVEVFSRNYLFGYDQGLFFEKVKRIVIDHKLTLIGEEVGGQGGFFQGPGFYYLLAIPFTMFHGDPYGAMLLMFGISAATLVLVALFTTRAFGRSTAVCTTLLVAVSPIMISQSRFIWNPFVIPILMITVLFLFYKILKKNSRLLPVMFFVIGLMFHFEIAIGIMVFLEFCIFSLVLLRLKYIRVKDIFYSLVLFLFTQIPFVVFDFRHDFLITKGVFETAFGKAPHAITQVYIQHMFGNHLEVFRFVFYTLFPYGNRIWPFILVLLVGGIIGMSKDTKLDKAKKYFLWFLIFSPFVSFGLYMKYLWPMRDWWLTDVGVVIVVLFGLVCGWLYEKNGIGRIAVILLCIFFICFHLFQTNEFYKIDFHDYGGTHKIRGKLDAIDAIYLDANGEPFNVLVYSPPIYTYPYDYLLWWHGTRKYGYVPGNEKQGIFYLLIEPDGNRPWEYKGWQETVIKTGVVIKTWTLPSGFIIEKRQSEQL